MKNDKQEDFTEAMKGEYTVLMSHPVVREGTGFLDPNSKTY